MIENKITIDEIAKRANVSIATVSRIINNKDNVKSETKQRVVAIMEELNFSPKTPASLSDVNSKIILMCVPDFENPDRKSVV